MAGECSIKELDLAIFERFDQETRHPSNEFQNEYRDLIKSSQKKGELTEFLEKKAPWREIAFDLDKKPEPKKDAKKSDLNGSNGNTDGKLQLAEISDNFLRDKRNIPEESLSKYREQAQCDQITLFKNISDEMEKFFPSLRHKVKTDSAVDLSPLYQDPKKIDKEDGSKGTLLPDLENLQSISPNMTYEKFKEKPALFSQMKPEIQRLLLTDQKVFEIYKETQLYVQRYNFAHSDPYSLSSESSNSKKEVVVDTKLDRAEAEAVQLDERDSKTPLQYLAKAKEAIPRLVVTAYLMRQRLGLIHSTQETNLHIGYFAALYRLSPSLFEADADLQAIRAVLDNQEFTSETKALFADGVLTEEEFGKATEGIRKLGNPTKKKAIWKKVLALQGKVLQPFHLWPPELSAKVGELEKEERNAIEALELGEADRQMAKVVKGLITAENAKYFQELCEVGSICKNTPEKKEEIWNTKVIGHSMHPKPPEGIYDRLISSIPHINASDTQRAEIRAEERHTALETFLEFLRAHPDYTVEQVVTQLKKNQSKVYEVLDKKMYLSERIRLSKLSEMDYGLQRVEFAKKLRRGIGTEYDHVRREVDPVYIDGELVKDRTLETYYAELELKDVESSYPDGVTIFKGNSLNPLLGQLSPEDKQWYLDKKKSIEFEGDSVDMDEIYARIGKKYVGFIEYLETDIQPKLPSFRKKDPEVSSLYSSSKAAFVDSEGLAKGEYPDLTKARKVFTNPSKKNISHKLEEREATQKLSIEGYLLLVRFLLASAEEAKTAGVSTMLQEMANKVFKDRNEEFKKFIEFALAERSIKAKEEELPYKFVVKTGQKLLKSYVEYAGRMQTNPPQPKATASRLTGKTENGFFCPAEKPIEGLTGFGALLEVGFPDKADQEEVQRLIKKQIPEDKKQETKTASFMLPSLSDFLVNNANAESLPPEQNSGKQKDNAAQAIQDRADYFRLIKSSLLSEENKEKLRTLWDNMPKTAASVLAKEELGGLLGRRKYNFSGSNSALDVANFKIHYQGGLSSTLYNGGLMRGFGLAIYPTPSVAIPLFGEFSASGLAFIYMRAIKKKSDYKWGEHYIKLPMWGRVAAVSLILGATILLPAFKPVREYSCDLMGTPIPRLSDDARSNLIQEAVQIGESLAIAGYASFLTFIGFKKGMHELFTRRGGTILRYGKARYNGGKEAGKKFWEDQHMDGPLDLLFMRGQKTYLERLLEKARAEHPKPIWFDKLFEKSHQELRLELAEAQRGWSQAKLAFEDTEREINRLRLANNTVPSQLEISASSQRDALMAAQEKAAEIDRALASASRVGVVGENHAITEDALGKLKPLYERRDHLNKQIDEASRSIPELRARLKLNGDNYRHAHPEIGDDLSLIQGEPKTEREILNADLDKQLRILSEAKQELAQTSKSSKEKIREVYLHADQAMQKLIAEAQGHAKFSLQMMMTKGSVMMSFYDGVHSAVVNPLSETWSHSWIGTKTTAIIKYFSSPDSKIKKEALSTESIEEVDDE